jgi:tape measure domain-containing protein
VIHPLRMLVFMIVALAALAAGGALAAAPLLPALEAHPVAHALIGAVAAAGIVIELARTWALAPATRWVDQTKRGFAAKDPAHVIAPVARVLAGREREGFTVSLPAMRSLLDMSRERLERPRVVTWFIGGLLAGLGIAGALWPLVSGGPAPHYPTLLLGLAACAILAALHLARRHAENVFMATLEDFFAARAELPSSVLGAEASLPQYLEALLRQAAESLADLQRLMTRADEERAATQAAIRALTEELAALSDQLRAEHKVMIALSKNHNDLQPMMQDFTQEFARGIAGGEELRSHVRRIDLTLERLAEEVGVLRGELPHTLRQEARVLAQSVLGRKNNREPLTAAQ